MDQEPKPGPQSGGINVSGGNISAQRDIAGRDQDTVHGDKVENKNIYLPPPIPVSALHQLPTPPADFIGRADELKELLGAVKTGGVTISGLQGLGGVGKTALALKLAEQLKPDYLDAQFYLDLKGVTKPLSPRDAMAYIIRAWHPTAQLPEKEEELAAIYRSVLDGKRVLLLMDNARDAQQVAPLIPPAGCLLLVTSRKHFTLPGLVEKNLDKLPPADASDLLLRIAPRLKTEKTDQVDELARLCGYLPLALRAVASALQEKKNISPADYAARLKETGKHLVLKEIDPSLQKSVEAALQSSYDLLSDDLRQKFRSLSVFPDTFDNAAAAAVWKVPPETSQDAMGELLAYSLVEFDEVSKRFGLHDLVRFFGDAKLKAACQLNAANPNAGRFFWALFHKLVGSRTQQRLDAQELLVAQQRHAGHYLEIIRNANNLYQKGGESLTRGLAAFDKEWTNIKAGHDWAVLHRLDAKEGAKWCVLYPLFGSHCLPLRQTPSERIDWLEPALVAARRLKQRNHEGSLLGALGNAYFDLCEYERTIEFHNRFLLIARQIGNRAAEGTALCCIGAAYDFMGEHRRGIEYQEKFLRIARETGDRRAEANALGNLGVAYDGLGEYDHAIKYHEKRLEIVRLVGDRLGEGQTLGNLGVAYLSLGRYYEANAYFEQSFVIATEIGDQRGRGYSLFNRAIILDREGNRDKAISLATASLDILQSLETPHATMVRDQLAEWRGEDKASGKIG